MIDPTNDTGALDLFATASSTPPPTRTRAALPDSFSDRPPSAPGSATSAHAAAVIAPAFRTKSFLIHQHIKQCGAHGATRKEIARACEVELSAVCAAVHTLYRQGLIGSNPGHTRMSDKGLANEVLVDESLVERWRGVPRRSYTMLDDARCDLIDDSGNVVTRKHKPRAHGARP